MATVISDDYLEQLKFNDCLPDALVYEMLIERLLSREEMTATLTEPVVEVVL